MASCGCWGQESNGESCPASISRTKRAVAGSNMLPQTLVRGVALCPAPLVSSAGDSLSCANFLGMAQLARIKILLRHI
jgi:hypothetical protein